MSYRTFKMTTRIIISTIILTLLLTSCDDPDISFDRPFPKRNKNLWWKLGNQFSIRKNNDTITYRLAFNSADRKNYIINTKTRDTIFAGTVSKYRGLYFFDHQFNDTTYWISVVDIDKGIFTSTPTIRGLGTVYQQMKVLQKQVNQGKHKQLIQHIDADSNIRMKPDKKLLHDFYSSIIDSLPAYTIIKLETPEKTINKSVDTTTTDDTDTAETIVDFEEFEIIKKVYPNPAQNHINIMTYQADQYHFDLVDNTGKFVHRGQLTGKSEKIDLTDIQKGIYVLRIYTADKYKVETMKIIKK